MEAAAADMKRTAAYIAGLCFVAPTASLLLMRLTSSGTAPALLCTVAAFAVDISILLNGSLYSSRSTLLEAWRFIEEHLDIVLIRRSPQEYGIDERVIRRLKTAYGFAFVKGGTELELYQVVCLAPPMPDGVLAFDVGGRTLVFLRDPPGNLSNWQLFCLYHEIGHADPISPSFRYVQYSSFLSSILLAAILIAATWATTSLWFVLLSITLVITTKLLFFRKYRVAGSPVFKQGNEHRGRAYRMAELSADRFAIYFSMGRVDLGDVIRKIQKFYPDELSTHERLRSLRLFQADPSACMAPDLPEIPLQYSAWCWLAVLLLSLRLRIEEIPWLPVYFAGMFGFYLHQNQSIIKRLRGDRLGLDLRLKLLSRGITLRKWLRIVDRGQKLSQYRGQN